VLGGAATLPVERGRGAQATLLQLRLGIARQAGGVRAIATLALSHQARGTSKGPGSSCTTSCRGTNPSRVICQ
jgi:hypothetical protein